jgi:hypothetical protein
MQARLCAVARFLHYGFTPTPFFIGPLADLDRTGSLRAANIRASRNPNSLRKYDHGLYGFG